MSIKPMLGDWEIKGIEQISTQEDRDWHEYAVPQLDGSIFQNLGEFPTAIEIRGSVFGEAARDAFLNEARDKLNSGEPVAFVADILTATGVNTVVIAALEVEQVAHGVDHFLYRLVLKEFVPPPPAPADVDLALGLDAEELFDDIELGLLNLPELPGLLNLDLVNPVTPLKTIVDSFTGAVAGMDGVLQPLNNLLNGPST